MIGNRRATSSREEHVTTIVLEGSGSGATTTIPLTIGQGDALALADLGVPMESRKRLVRLSVAWLDGGAPSGDWTLTVYKRAKDGTTWSQVGTYAVTTS